MKIEITAGGIYGVDGKEIPVGTEFDVKHEPTEWAGRYRVVNTTAGKTAATGKTEPVDPAKAELEAMGVEDLAKLAADEKIDLKGASAPGDMIAAILAGRAAKKA